MTPGKSNLPAFYPTSLQSVTVVVNDGKPSEISFQSTIRLIHDDGRMEIDVPEHINASHLTAGLELRLQYKSNEVFYYLFSRILTITQHKVSRIKSGVMYRLMIAAQNNAEKIQRRDYYRISERMNVNLIAVTLPEHYTNDPEIRRRSLTEWKKQSIDDGLQIECLDLSGGGMGGLCGRPLKPNQHYMMTFYLDKKEFCCTANVRHCTELSFGKYKIGLEFVGMSEKDRESIIQFVFKAQTQRLATQKSP